LQCRRFLLKELIYQEITLPDSRSTRVNLLSPEAQDLNAHAREILIERRWYVAVLLFVAGSSTG